VLRSTAKDWDGFPCFGKNKQVDDVAESGGIAVFRHFSRLARPLYCSGHNAEGQTDFREEDMVDMSKLGQTILATIGAMVLTATAVGAAVGPARAIETAPISLVAASVPGQAQA
jgi:hypothetical protein